MKVTKKKIVDLLNALDRFEMMSAGGNVFLPGKISYALRKNYSIVEAKFKSEISSKHQEIQDSYVRKDDKGQYQMNKEKTKYIFIDPAPENEKKFQKEREKLLSQETEMDFYRILELDGMMNDIKGNHDVLNLLWVIVDEINGTVPQKKVEKAEKEEQKLEAVK